MAKRKSTEKTSTEETESKVETDRAPDEAVVSEEASKNLDKAEEAVEAEEVKDAAGNSEGSEQPTESTPIDTQDAATVDVIEMPEPEKDTAADETADTAMDSESVEGDTDNDATADAVDDDHLTEEEAEILIEEAESSEFRGTAPDVVSDTTPIAPQVIKETTIERQGGFFPMLLGGAAAAVLGYGVAAYSSQAVWPFKSAEDTGFETELRDALTTQDGALSELGARIATLEGVEVPTVDLSGIEGQIATLQSTSDDLVVRLGELASRMDTLERQPLENAVSEEAIAAYERALADLQAEVETQRAEVAQMAQSAVAAEENAEEKAQLAASRAALAEMTSALDTGTGYAGAVEVLTANGISVPEALVANSESGVATQSALIEAFPDVARAALSAARRADTDSVEGMSRITTFFANQLGARSVAPKEGDDPNAILSRAEAAARSGDLSAALAELSALPEVAQSAVADWQARAETRLTAKTAVDGLVQQLLQE